MKNNMTKQEEIYLPMLDAFCAQFENCYVSYLYGLFLPNAAPKYNEISPKVFYIGKETKSWEPEFKDMLEYCLTNNAINYIREQNKWLCNQSNILKEAKNPFWNTIIKLHIYLHTNKPVTDLRKLNENQLELLNSIGWGNLNSIITKEGLEQYSKEWEGDFDWWGEEDISYELYDKIKKESYVFDKLKFVLDIYNPDVIFIFNENKNEEKHYKQFLDGLKLTWCSETKIYDDFLASYSIEEYNTKIIWTAHPRTLAQKVGSMEGAIDKLKNAYDILIQNRDIK